MSERAKQLIADIDRDNKLIALLDERIKLIKSGQVSEEQLTEFLKIIPESCR